MVCGATAGAASVLRGAAYHLTNGMLRLKATGAVEDIHEQV
jgi:hypothetical protein